MHTNGTTAKIETYSEPTDAGAFQARLAEIMLQSARIPEEVALELQPSSPGTALYILATTVASMPDKAFAAVARFLESTRGIKLWKAKDKIEAKRDELRTYLIRDLAEGGRLGPELVTHAGSLMELEAHAKRVAAEKIAAAQPPAKKPSKAASALAARREKKPAPVGETQAEVAEAVQALSRGEPVTVANERQRQLASAGPSVGNWTDAPVGEEWIDKLEEGDIVEIAWQPQQSGTRTTLGGPSSKAARFVRWSKRNGNAHAVAVVNVERVDSRGRGTGAYGSDRSFDRAEILSLYRKADGSSIVAPPPAADPAIEIGGPAKSMRLAAPEPELTAPAEELVDLEPEMESTPTTHHAAPGRKRRGAPAAEVAPATPAPKKRGRARDELIYELADSKTVQELQALYAEMFGRPTRATHKRVLAWRIVKARRALERGENPRANMPAARGQSIRLSHDQARAIVKLCEHLAGGKVKVGAMPPLAPLLAALAAIEVAS